MDKIYQDDMINSEELAFLGERDRARIRELFSQGIKHKMKMNFVRKISKSSGNWTEKDPEKDVEMNNLHIDEELEVEDSKCIESIQYYRHHNNVSMASSDKKTNWYLI